MSKQLLALLIFGLSVNITYSQALAKIENIELFNDVFHIQKNDSIAIEKYNISGVVHITDTSNIATFEVNLYEVDSLTNNEIIINNISGFNWSSSDANNNLTSNIFIVDEKVYFTFKDISSIKGRYIRLKIINQEHIILDSISTKIIDTN
jgi:hypothetical protein